MLYGYKTRVRTIKHVTSMSSYNGIFAKASHGLYGGTRVKGVLQRMRRQVGSETAEFPRQAPFQLKLRSNLLYFCHPANVIIKIRMRNKIFDVCGSLFLVKMRVGRRKIERLTGFL